MKECMLDLAITAAALVLTICGCKGGAQDISTSPKTDITTVIPPATVTADTAFAAASESYVVTTVGTVPTTAPDPIAETAEALIGTPFLYGGSTPSGFDNSGFIYYVLRENGYISCPRTISEQMEWASGVCYDELSAGDIAYFSEEPGGEAEIGGVCVGDGKMVFAPSPGKTVAYADITSEYWRSRFVAAISL